MAAGGDCSHVVVQVSDTFRSDFLHTLVGLQTHFGSCFGNISVHASETFGTGSSAHLGVRVWVHSGAGDRVESGAECWEEGCWRVLEESGHGVGEDVAECMVEHFGA